MRIALTGGIACGKSMFAKFLTELGVRVVDADDVVHELESPGGAAVAAIAERFGDEVIAADGGIDRERLAEKVFSSPAERAVLEDILFPLVRARLASDRGQEGVLTVHVIPLLFESHWEKDYDIILCVVSPVEMQIDRMTRGRGYSRAHAEARLAAQMPVAEKATKADYVVNNYSTPVELKAKAEGLVAWMKERTANERRRGNEEGRLDAGGRKRGV